VPDKPVLGLIVICVAFAVDTVGPGPASTAKEPSSTMGIENPGGRSTEDWTPYYLSMCT